MITIGLMGGLGNQLFQIFALISYAYKHHIDFLIPYSDKLVAGTTRPTYWHSFFSKLLPFTSKHIEWNEQIAEPYFHYAPLREPTNHCQLYGYFQSPKYFDQYYEQIANLIGIRDMRQQVLSKTNELFIDSSNTVSLHFRLGDYKHLQQYHPLMPVNYYFNALQFIMSQIRTDAQTIIYFCENDDLVDVSAAIQQLRQMLPNSKFICAPTDLCDWEQLLLMSHCQHNVIANSSFSWWGGYMNDYDGKIICYPHIWFGPAVTSLDTKDLFPPNWHKVIW